MFVKVVMAGWPPDPRGVEIPPCTERQSSLWDGDFATLSLPAGQPAAPAATRPTARSGERRVVRIPRRDLFHRPCRDARSRFAGQHAPGAPGPPVAKAGYEARERPLPRKLSRCPGLITRLTGDGQYEFPRNPHRTAQSRPEIIRRRSILSRTHLNHRLQSITMMHQHVQRAISQFNCRPWKPADPELVRLAIEVDSGSDERLERLAPKERNAP